MPNVGGAADTAAEGGAAKQFVPLPGAVTTPTAATAASPAAEAHAGQKRQREEESGESTHSIRYGLKC